MPVPKIKKKSNTKTSLKSRGESKKSQGSDAKPASASSLNQVRSPRTPERGIGSAFAMALSRQMNSVTKGSSSGFLGVEKKDISVSEHAHTLSDNKGKKRK